MFYECCDKMYNMYSALARRNNAIVISQHKLIVLFQNNVQWSIRDKAPTFILKRGLTFDRCVNKLHYDIIVKRYVV